MAENNPFADDRNEKHCFKEAVCVDASRIYDSCCSKDCLEDLRVYFTECTQRIVDNAISVKSRKAKLITVYIDLEPVPFNRGFYSVDLTYFFEVKLDVYSSPVCNPVSVKGLAMFNKKVILYGSEGNVKVFTSEFRMGEDDIQEAEDTNLPKAVCQVAEPVVLSAKVCEHCKCNPCNIPSCMNTRFQGDFVIEDPEKIVYVTLGVFSIIQIERDVQMLMPIYDFCIPEKECCATDSNPCDLFRQIKFPTDEFFPPRVEELGCGEEIDMCCDDDD